MVKHAALLALIIATHSYANVDPTAPLGWESPTKTEQKRTPTYPVPALQSIVCAEGNRCYAIIEQTVVAQGDVVNGYHVTAIHPDQVKLTRAGKEWQLALFALDIKQ
ncbi:MSHA biogenesis protein MshK [Vibrio metoecus]|uniref:MSHA biogenesis protein MshK n=1 Tax=Vibrio metoecus TaxID=1481663 RepID=A0A0Q0QIR5_VIBMT|nr:MULTISPECIES: MSHA biogenesis protein MshK [Vibrio]KQA21533.1 MSHA biogenesis protein MshK [Vibrio metoecus]KQA22895.1 MSHA biogenesis protein MshK [Vibrio metoecus]KQA99253.1 MSHA biogenesis protein MshK [Vibrio metoecus]KQB01512.1 MSHA biogenesis protein MshK [Vibrio metoecus]KQB07103.1 MSHA biogenesis protein MshK [Vibrio metoecus]